MKVAELRTALAARGCAARRGRLGTAIGTGRARAAALLLLEDRVADLDALVADVHARRAGDEGRHLVARLLAEGAAFDLAAGSSGRAHAVSLGPPFLVGGSIMRNGDRERTWIRSGCER